MQVSGFECNIRQDEVKPAVRYTTPGQIGD